MAWVWPWRGGAGNGEARPERKEAGGFGFVALHGGSEARWGRRDYHPQPKAGTSGNCRLI